MTSLRLLHAVAGSSSMLCRRAPQLHRYSSVFCRFPEAPSIGQSRLYGSSTMPKPKANPSLPKPKRGPIFSFSWLNFAVSMSVGGVLMGSMYYVRQAKDAEIEKKRRRQMGKAKIGGPWAMQHMDGKQMTDKDFLGQWTLLYFGFTHCPDICPDEIEKMIKVADTLDSTEDHETMIPIFFTVDPARDSASAVKAYCADFSPKLQGFTGTPDQVGALTKTYRIYSSQGPKDEQDDYIVDHSVIMYLVDPEGQFVDYFGQNKTAEEVIDGIRLQILKYRKGKAKGWW